MDLWNSAASALTWPCGWPKHYGEGTPVITLDKLTKGKTCRDVSDPTLPRVGVVMDIRHGRAYMRPLGGGLEWSRPLGEVEPYSLSSALSPRVAEINDRARNRPR